MSCQARVSTGLYSIPRYTPMQCNIARTNWTIHSTYIVEYLNHISILNPQKSHYKGKRLLQKEKIGYCWC